MSDDSDEIRKFTDFDIDERFFPILEEDRIRIPSPIQVQAIPVGLTGQDVIGIAQTGTGKTLAYVLPLLTGLANREEGSTRGLILVPTRELCTQVYDVVKRYGEAVGVKAVAVYGGMGMKQQADKLRQGQAVVVATPGRLLDHMRRRNADFRKLEVLVLDEADRMLDMGFLPDIKEILRKLPEDRHTMAFSATFPDEIARLTNQMMKEPERISVGQVHKPVDAVTQALYPVLPEDKPKLLLRILENKDLSSTIIFCRRRDRTEKIYTMLDQKGLKIAQIHGDRSQREREQALKGFREGKYPILVATDVAARGLDIEGVTHVINYDIPPTADDYLHRIGRTARAYAKGDAITFVCPNEHNELANIERALGKNIPRKEWDGAPPILTLYHGPDSKRRGRRSRRGPGRLMRRR